MIKFLDVSKYYKDTLALKGINLEVSKGEIFGIIGSSGAGKSTLVRCINGIEPFNSGSLVVDGQDLSTLTKTELNKLRNEIGFVFQNFNLMTSLTVFENIALPLKINKKSQDEINLRVLELLEIVGLSDKKDVYIKDLSGGQKQRVGIARSLALNPKVLLCDEATSALDPNTTEQILDLILDINKKFKITVVIITHEMEVVRRTCDRVAVMSHGEVVETGRVIDIFANATHVQTKELIKNVFSSLSKDLVKLNGGNYLIEFKYITDAEKNHAISNLARDIKVDFSIIGGQIVDTRQGKFGQLVVEFIDKKSEVLEWIDKKDIKYEVIS